LRIALISDVHGNPVALDAVLEDCRSQGIEEYWFLGDYAAIGPEPVAALERIAGLKRTRVIRGNTDGYIVTGEGPPPSLEKARADPALIPTYAAIAASFAWTRAFVTASGWFEWLAALPLDVRLTTPGGMRLLAVHASPGRDDGEGVHRGRGNQDLAELIEGADADVIFVGHTHEPMVRRVGGVHLVNLGSVSNPCTDDLRACYVQLEIGDTGVTFQHRPVEYDRQEFVARVHGSGHPAAAFILSYLRGAQTRKEAHPDHVPPHLGKSIRIP